MQVIEAKPAEAPLVEPLDPPLSRSGFSKRTF